MCEAGTDYPAPFPPLPNPAQLRWHKAEQMMFVHFGMKTFYPSDNHMGTGKEDPQMFNPVKFDADQWVAAAKAGGFTGIVFTTKHHDGFCNWPTDTTAHNVSASPWRDGKGDVVREVAEACRRGGIKFGIYVSIIDMHFSVAGSPWHEVYGDYYYEQLQELCTRYGVMDEFWFDGFNAENLKLDYPKIAKLIAETQPTAVIYDSGVMVHSLPDRCLSWPGEHGGVRPDQNYRKTIDGVLRWYPNEPSMMFQGNWFHDLQPIKPLPVLQDYYLTSTGYGVTPLLNISPNQDGLIDEDTVEALKVYKAWVDGIHNDNLVALPDNRISGSEHRGGDARFAPARAFDGDYETYFAPPDDVTTAVLEVAFQEPREIGGFILQEYIPLGQRVTSYSLSCRVDGAWKDVFAGHRIGYKRIILEGRANADKVTFPKADAVRLTISGADASPLISNFQVVGKGH